jgi:hypothetical protein
LVSQDLEDLLDTNAPATSIQALSDLIQSIYPGILGGSGPEVEGSAGGE